MKPFVSFGEPLLSAAFLKREKRFLAHMELPDGARLTAHCPNTGSMRSCLLEGAPTILHDSGNPARKYRCTWKAIKIGQTWIGVDTMLPNRLAQKALAEGLIPGVEGYSEILSEKFIAPGTRIDLLLKGDGLPDFCVEVKNVTLVEEGLARFPDAVTERGRKHLVELSKAVADGKRAAMIYVVQRGDGLRFAPARDIDPEYAAALKKAVKAGVEVYALAAEVTETGVYAVGLLPCSF